MVMTEQTPLIEDVPTRAHDIVQAVLGTALSLTLAAGIGAWAFIHQGGAGSAGPVSTERHEQGAPASTQSRSAPTATAAAPLGDDLPRGTSGTLEPRKIYLVASEAQAAEVQASIEEANTIRVSLGLPPLEDRPLLFSSEDEEVGFWRARGDEDAVRDALGLPPLQFVDLRKPAD